MSLSPENELHEGGDWHLACGAGAQSTFVKRTEPPVTNTKPSPGLPAHSTLTTLLRGSFIPNWGSPKHPQIPVPLPQLEHVHTLSVKCLAKSCPPYRRVNAASSSLYLPQRPQVLSPPSLQLYVPKALYLFPSCDIYQICLVGQLSTPSFGLPPAPRLSGEVHRKATGSLRVGTVCLWHLLAEHSAVPRSERGVTTA